jgi:hypothetical protein
MLSPMPTVPHVLAAEVQGIDSRLLVVLTDTASLWVIGRDMAQVQLDAARMVEGGREPPALDRPVGPDPLRGL